MSNSRAERVGLNGHLKQCDHPMKSARRWLTVLVAVGLLASRSVGQTQGFPPIVVTETANGTTVDAFVGQSISVNLRGNLTTGYAWVQTATNGDSVLTNGPVEYIPDQGGVPGSGGTFSFPFLASTSGDTTLSFEYRPPGGGTPSQTFSVTIHVTPAPPRLSIALLKSSVVITWPIAGSTNYFLEGTPSLGPPQWAALNVLPLPEGTNYVVTLGTSGKALYFRLHRL